VSPVDKLFTGVSHLALPSTNPKHSYFVKMPVCRVVDYDRVRPIPETER